MLPERAINPEATVMAPYHPGAIELYKEIGRWSEVVEAANKKRLAHVEKVNKRWAACVEEALERIARTGKKVETVKEWREIVEKEIGLLP